MGREVKRVPLDFDWPMKEIWKGYINDRPDTSKKCVLCGGTGNSRQYQHLHDQWYGYVPFDPVRRGVPLLSEKDPAVQAFAKRNVERAPEFYGTDHVAIQYEATRLASMWRKQWCHHLNQDDINALIEAGRLMDFTDTWTQGEGWKPKVPAYIPTPKEVNKWLILSMGHDAINAWVCIKAECKRNGWETSCAMCEGEGHIWP